MCKNTTEWTYNISQLLYAKNQMPNNAFYEGHVFKLDQQQCISYNYNFPTNSSKLIAYTGSSE